MLLRLAGFVIPTHLILCVKQYMNSPLFPLYVSTVNGQYHKNTSKLVCNVIISNSTFKGQLIGLICHKGLSTSSGHYTAAINNNNNWYHCIAMMGKLVLHNFQDCLIVQMCAFCFIREYMAEDNIKQH